MPGTNNDMLRKDRRGSPDLDQDDHRNGNRYRRRRLHRNTQRAMVGIVVYWMRMSHLDHGQQRQQNQTHHRDDRQSAWLQTATTT
jgi:hypothetical protein